MKVSELKRNQLEEVARHREYLRENPHLVWLFFELTNSCNLRCAHCGSSCGAAGDFLAIEDIERTLDSLKPLGEDLPMICLTGGEPMLHPQFFEIANAVRKKNFSWGMTTNATLIDDEAALRLKKAGMATVSVSLDGLEEAHDRLRGQKGAWKRAVAGIKVLRNAGFMPQVTSVFHRDNFHELEPMYDFLCELGVKDWRPINVEPIGRACEAEQMLLSKAQYEHLLDFISKKRFDGNCDITFGCSHYLGIDRELMVREHYFLCGAGILVASIRSNGDICACLDVENRQDLVQGNIKRDNFLEIWKSGFKAFRRDRTKDCSLCIECGDRFICGGDSTHTWDFENKRPLLCLMRNDA